MSSNCDDARFAQGHRVGIPVPESTPDGGVVTGPTITCLGDKGSIDLGAGR